MQCISTKKELRAVVKKLRAANRTIGFVPTMGFLHDGHLSLIRKARSENDVVVVSVFVNPTQFGANEDLEAYPRNHQRDQALMEAEKTDIAFFPTIGELYPDGYSTYVQVEGHITENLCGRSRPGHFRGVATIVTKLFNLVSPDKAYFGQKDAQQVAVIIRMAEDLDMDLEIVPCPTVRESDGLAMSSRNTYLSPEHRRQAPGIYQALEAARAAIEAGERKGSEVIRAVRNGISAIPEAEIEYIEVVDARTLSPLETVSGPVLIAAAVNVGHTRLIDNIRFDI
jgi:pantoate--beta-alanine ligase